MSVIFQLLLAENEYIEREAMKIIINRKFSDTFEIKEAVNGKEAVELAREFHPDVIFMDIKMPGYSGIEATRQIREELPETIIIFVTAYDCFDYAKEAISLRVQDFLVKPVDIQQVYEVLENVINRLEEVKKSKDKDEQFEMKFSLVKKQFQHEFIELVQSYQSPVEAIQNMSKVMDLTFRYMIVGYLEFSNIVKKEGMGSIQQEFLRNRYVEKLEQLCSKHKITCMTGTSKDTMPILLFWDEEEKEKLEMLTNRCITQCNQLLELQVQAFLSEAFQEIDAINKTMLAMKQKLFEEKQKDKVKYPYELEEEVMDAIKKKEYEQAREGTMQILEVLKESTDSLSKKREFLGLYAMIKRMMLRTSPEIVLEHFDYLAEEAMKLEEMRSFFQHLFDYMIENQANRSDRNQVLIKNICDYIDAHYAEDFSLEEAAAVVGFSPYYFTKLMKEYRNMSFIDYVTSVRITNAKKMLESTVLSVKEVGSLVGYDDANYFSRVFKREVGLTPKQYKMNYMK